MILCFLQNLWVKDPDQLRNFLKRYPNLRIDIIRRLLFYKCLTGRRIKACFGEDLVEKMTFEEASLEIAGDARTICPPDPKHIKACIEKYKPQIIVTFGKVAAEALDNIYWISVTDLPTIPIIHCPHPAARQIDTVAKLQCAAKQIREKLKGENHGTDRS